MSRPPASPLFPYTTLFRSCKRGGQQQAPQQEGVPVTVAQVEKKTVPQQVSAIGTVEPMHTVQVRTLVGGTLVGVHFQEGDRKSTRLNSSHANISYAVFCLK